MIAARRAELDAQAAKTVEAARRQAKNAKRAEGARRAWERRRERMEAVARDIEHDAALLTAWEALPVSHKLSFASGEAFADYAHDHPHILDDAFAAMERDANAEGDETEDEYVDRRDVRWDTLIDADFGSQWEALPF